ncbi:MAG: hypothetical protein ABSE07_10230 [Methanoregula sp.]
MKITEWDASPEPHGRFCSCTRQKKVYALPPGTVPVRTAGNALLLLTRLTAQMLIIPEI